MFDLIFCATDDLQLCFNAPIVWSGGKGTLVYSHIVSVYGTQRKSMKDNLQVFFFNRLFTL